MKEADAIAKTVQMSLLFDFYGQLLTERQRQFFALYYDDDLSLGEIAQQYGVSRQAVYDILRRSTETLTGLEAKLGLVERHGEQTAILERLKHTLLDVEAALAGAGGRADLLERVRAGRREIESLL